MLGITNNNTGATNGSATAITATNNNATSPTVRATNNAGGTALDLVTTCRIGPACFKAPPMSVNSDTKVANLNADKLDGMDASDFVAEVRKQRIQTSSTGSTPQDSSRGWERRFIGEAIVPASRERSCTTKVHDLFPVRWQRQWSGSFREQWALSAPPVHRPPEWH